MDTYQMKGIDIEQLRRELSYFLMRKGHGAVTYAMSQTNLSRGTIYRFLNGAIPNGATLLLLREFINNNSDDTEILQKNQRITKEIDNPKALIDPVGRVIIGLQNALIMLETQDEPLPEKLEAIRANLLYIANTQIPTILYTTKNMAAEDPTDYSPKKKSS